VSSPEPFSSSQQQKDPAQSCWGSLLPPTASPRDAVRSPGRLSADPGRQQSPCPSTQPVGCTDPALKDSLGKPRLHIHLHNTAAVLGRRQLSWPVPLRVQQAITPLQHVLIFNKTQTVIFLMVHHAVRFGVFQLEEIFPQSADTLSCMQRLTV